MSLRQKNALINAIIWFILLLLFFINFFSGDGASEWASNQTKRIIAPALIFVGYTLQFIIAAKSKKEPQDERALLAQLRSTSASMIIVIMYVFIFSITIYTVYGNDQVVPISWFWFIGFSTVMLTYFVNSFLYFILEYQGEGYGNK